MIFFPIVVLVIIGVLLVIFGFDTVFPKPTTEEVLVIEIRETKDE